jgi:peptidoglycan/LPS O-acetylase OafA/YrhL
MLQSIASVVAGYFALAVIVIIGTIAATAATIPGGLAAAKNPDLVPPRSYLIANLALSFVGAMFGGWLCARLAPSNPLIHAAVLAVFLIVMSAISAKSQGRNQPPWYPWTIGAAGAAGVLIGALWEVWSSAI